MYANAFGSRINEDSLFWHSSITKLSDTWRSKSKLYQHSTKKGVDARRATQKMRVEDERGWEGKCNEPEKDLVEQYFSLNFVEHVEVIP